MTIGQTDQSSKPCPPDVPERNGVRRSAPPLSTATPTARRAPLPLHPDKGRGGLLPQHTPPSRAHDPGFGRRGQRGFD